MKSNRSRGILGLVAAVAVCEAVGGAGALASASGISEWYPSLRKPRINPPGWIFGPVWTALYAAMGVAAFLVWRRAGDRRDARRALGLFGAQLTLNGLWSPAFFGLRSPAAGMVDITALWLTLGATIRAFARVSRPATWLMWPYLAWTSFAAVLNGAIWWLNR